MEVIALTGPKGVGKTSIARAIEANHWDRAAIYSFADPIRTGEHDSEQKLSRADWKIWAGNITAAAKAIEHFALR